MPQMFLPFEDTTEMMDRSFSKSLMPKKGEQVNHPQHYGGEDNPYEAIKVIEAWRLGFCLGNTVKYISRAGKKDNALQDLKKAKWYLDRHIESLEKSMEKDTELKNPCRVCRYKYARNNRLEPCNRCTTEEAGDLLIPSHFEREDEECK